MEFRGDTDQTWFYGGRFGCTLANAKSMVLVPFWGVAIFRVLVCTLADIAAFPYISCGPLFVRSAMVTKVCFTCKKKQDLGLKARGGSRLEGLR